MAEQVKYPDGLYVRKIPPFRAGFTQSVGTNGETYSVDAYKNGGYVATDLYSSTHGYGETWEEAVDNLMGITASGE